MNVNASAQELLPGWPRGFMRTVHPCGQGERTCRLGVEQTRGSIPARAGLGRTIRWQLSPRRRNPAGFDALLTGLLDDADQFEEGAISSGDCGFRGHAAPVLEFA